MDERKIDILKMYFTALREEALERVKLVSRIELGKFVIVTTVLGFAIGKGVPEKEMAGAGMVAVFGLLPFLAFLFDCYIAFNQSMIHKIGEYIHDHIEKALNIDVKLWEHYISESNQSKWDALGRIVHMSTTALTIFISGIFFNSAIEKWEGSTCVWMTVYIIGYVLLLTIDAWLLRIYDKFKRKYY